MRLQLRKSSLLSENKKSKRIKNAKDFAELYDVAVATGDVEYMEIVKSDAEDIVRSLNRIINEKDVDGLLGKYNSDSYIYLGDNYNDSIIGKSNFLTHKVDEVVYSKILERKYAIAIQSFWDDLRGSVLKPLQEQLARMK